MEQSILTSTKKVLHIGPDDDSFDLDVMTHINSAFSTLHDLGVGPESGFFVEDADKTWADFLPAGDTDVEKVQQNQVKTFVYLQVRLLFDPPTSAYLLEAAQKLLDEMISRISMRRENEEWTEPVVDLIDVIDGGDAG